MLKNTIDKQKNKKLISLLIIALLVIILLIAFITLENKTQLIAKVQETIRAQTETTIKEKLETAIAELKAEKQGKESLDDITQSWLDEKLAEYKCSLINDIFVSGKKIMIEDSTVITKFYIDEDLNVQEIESNDDNFSYENKGINGENIQLLIRIQDKEKTLRKIELPNGAKIECFGKTEYGLDYTVKFGEENKIKMISQDGTEQEETILIENYYHNITKNLAEGISIDNKAIKAANNQPYTAKITADENYALGKITVKMGETEIPVDQTTGEINIPNVTDDIEIIALTSGYEWEVWSCEESVSSTTHTMSNVSIATGMTASSSSTFTVYKSITNAGTQYTGKNAKSVAAKNATNSSSGALYYYYPCTYTAIGRNGFLYIEDINRVSNKLIFVGKFYYIKNTSTYIKGSTKYDNVRSGNADDYPENGIQDGYWYVRIK